MGTSLFLEVIGRAGSDGKAFVDDAESKMDKKPIHMLEILCRKIRSDRCSPSSSNSFSLESTSEHDERYIIARSIEDFAAVDRHIRKRLRTMSELQTEGIQLEVPLPKKKLRMLIRHNEPGLITSRASSRSLHAVNLYLAALAQTGERDPKLACILEKFCVPGPMPRLIESRCSECQSRIRRAREYSQYFTSRHLVEFALNLLEEWSPNILSSTNRFFVDPCAGDGAIFTRLPSGRRCAVELDPFYAQILRSKFTQLCDGSTSSPTDDNMVGCKAPTGERVCSDCGALWSLSEGISVDCQLGQPTEAMHPKEDASIIHNADFLASDRASLGLDSIPYHEAVVIGNPPFASDRGKGGRDLPARFIVHATAFADAIVMILPERFHKTEEIDAVVSLNEKYGRGTLRCVLSRSAPENKFNFCGRWITQPTVVQLWDVR